MGGAGRRGRPNLPQHLILGRSFRLFGVAFLTRASRVPFVRSGHSIGPRHRLNENLIPRIPELQVLHTLNEHRCYRAFTFESRCACFEGKCSLENLGILRRSFRLFGVAGCPRTSRVPLVRSGHSLSLRHRLSENLIPRIASSQALITLNERFCFREFVFESRCACFEGKRFPAHAVILMRSFRLFGVAGCPRTSRVPLVRSSHSLSLRHRLSENLIPRIAGFRGILT